MSTFLPTPVYQASGLASGLDTTSIVNQLVSIESQPITALQTQQTAMQSQVSALGGLASDLSALEAAAQALGAQGPLAISPTSTNTSFSATTTGTTQPGQYQIQVEQLAEAATARSQAFSSSTGAVTGGTLHLTVMGTGYDVAISDGESLSDVASAINQSGAGVNASVLSDGTNWYLSLANTDTGFPIGQSASSALSISEDTTGSQGQPLSASVVQPAQNAEVNFNGLDVTRTSNAISDLISGTTLNLQSVGSPEQLVLGTNSSQTAQNLQGFITAYNAVQQVVQSNLDINDQTDRTSTLAGDNAVRSLQQQMQSLISQVVPGSSTVQTLADLGITTGEDGSLSLDQSTLDTAIANDPNAVNSLFSTNSTGIGDATTAMVETFVDPVSGVLTAEQQGLNDQLTTINDNITNDQDQLASYRQTLLDEFTAMEQVVSANKSVGSFLTEQSNVNQQAASSS